MAAGLCMGAKLRGLGEAPGGGLMQGPVLGPLSQDDLAQLNAVVDRYGEAMAELSSYVHDLTVESQNNLLSGLFEHRIPIRRPLDPRQKVITTDPVKSVGLKRYFEEESEWGRWKRRVEGEVEKTGGFDVGSR